MANLASKLMDSGFWDEAKSLLDKARLMDEPHENVGNALYRLETLQKSEKEKWTELTKQSESFQNEMRIYGDAFFDVASRPIVFDGTWYTAEGKIAKIDVQGGEITGEWSEDRIGLVRSSTYRITISGTFRNRSARVTYRSKSANGGAASSLLSIPREKTVNCLSHLSADQQEWRFFSSEADEHLAFSLYKDPPK